MPEIIWVNTNAAVGDVFTGEDMGKFRQIGCKIFAAVDREENMVSIANKIFDTIDFLDENGKSMKAPTNCYAELLMNN